MSILKTNQEKAKLLEETIEYYSENTEKRSIGLVDNCIKCAYSGETVNKKFSSGCAIGRLLTPELSLEIDILFKDKPSGVAYVWGYLPTDIQAYGLPFLTQLQNLHDSNRNWDTNDLSKNGLTKVNEIVSSLVE